MFNLSCFLSTLLTVVFALTLFVGVDLTLLRVVLALLVRLDAAVVLVDFFVPLVRFLVDEAFRFVVVVAMRR